MNLTLLKTYAPAARKAFIEAVTRRAGVVGVHPDRVVPVTEAGDVALIGGKPFPRSIVPLRRQLAEAVQRDGFGVTMEAMAYTWFNRLVALRFMELHDGWLRHGYRVLSHPQAHSLPEILQHAEHLDLECLDREEVIRLKLDGNRDEELYRLLLLAQCAELHRILPDVFSRLDDATILLLPDNLLHSDSVIRQLVANSSEEDWQQVEILGWLYQFYISEKKDAVMARKSAVPTEDIPAVTQLFTPHWIVRYLVENSLGRLWLLNRPNSKLIDHMPYFVADAPQVSSVQCSVSRKEEPADDLFAENLKLETENTPLTITKPEDIRLCDPACGSGHMLTYAFDLLVLIYEEEGYAANDIPGFILKHNLHGLDLCPRAAQLAELALVFKAREKSRRFFQQDHLVRPNITELKDVRFEGNELPVQWLVASDQWPVGKVPAKADILHDLHLFTDAKNFGSLLQPKLSEAQIGFLKQRVTDHWPLTTDHLFSHKVREQVLRVLDQAEALTQRYHVVVANPPYMGSGAMNASIRTFLSSTINEGRADLYGAFILRNLAFLKAGGLCGMITIPNWLFLQSFSDLRRIVLNEGYIASLSHNGRGVWGGDFGSCAFVIEKTADTKRKGVFKRLFKKPGEIQSNVEIESNFHDLVGFPSYLRSSSDFQKLPGHLIAYWLSEQSLKLLSEPTIVNLGDAKRGLQPGDVEWLVKKWWEVFPHNVELHAESRAQAILSTKRWFKFDSGGAFRRWYGNNILVVDWEQNGRRIKSGHNPIVPSEHLYFEPGFVWSRITASVPSLRLHDGGVINGDVSPCFFPSEFRLGILGLLNSICASHFLTSISPTLTFLVSDVLKVPRCEIPAVADEICKEAVAIARTDWDNFETSWDFRDLPLLRNYEVGMMNYEGREESFMIKGANLEESWTNWNRYCTAAIRRMQELETENNRLFIAAYGLEGELQPEVPEEQITLARADPRKDMAAFLSYALGCMMGRFSLDVPGLILANAGDTVADYLRICAEKGTSNPNGMASSSPGLLGTSYPGSTAPPETNPNGVASGSPLPAGHNPVGVETLSASDSQGSACRATLGFGAESLWDSESGIRDSSFHPDSDGIVPVLDGEWFEDDVAARAKEFLRVTFGEATFHENITFIEQSLGKDLRTYFQNDFYKDHLQTYKNRPIYWLFSSGKQKAFQCLVYLHRYTPGTLARIRTEYVIPLQGKLAAAISRLEEEILKTSSSSARKKLQTELDKAKKQMVELLAFDEQLRNYADQRIALDLDDGVKVNYTKFGPLLAEAKKICGTKED